MAVRIRIDPRVGFAITHGLLSHRVHGKWGSDPLGGLSLTQDRSRIVARCGTESTIQHGVKIQLNVFERSATHRVAIAPGDSDKKSVPLIDLRKARFKLIYLLSTRTVGRRFRYNCTLYLFHTTGSDLRTD